MTILEAVIKLTADIISSNAELKLNTVRKRNLILVEFISGNRIIIRRIVKDSELMLPGESLYDSVMEEYRQIS